MLESRNIHKPDGVSVTTTREKNNLEYTEEGEDYLFLENAYDIIEEETGIDLQNLLTSETT